MFGKRNKKRFVSFNKIITNSSILIFYDAEKVTVRDSNKKYVGFILLLNEKSIWYTSQSLTKTEQNFINIKRKLFVACCSLEKYNQSIYEEWVEILQTDYKPEHMEKGPLIQCRNVYEDYL